MNDYKVEFSYRREDGRRIYENDITTADTAADAAEKVLAWYEAEGCWPEVRIEQVWIDTGRAWELRDFDY